MKLLSNGVLGERVENLENRLVARVVRGFPPDEIATVGLTTDGLSELYACTRMVR